MRTPTAQGHDCADPEVLACCTLCQFMTLAIASASSCTRTHPVAFTQASSAIARSLSGVASVYQAPGLRGAAVARQGSATRSSPLACSRLHISAVSSTASGSTLSREKSSRMSAEVPPATLPGTPKSFLIGEEKLISMAKHVFETSSGQKDASVLSDDFRFEFPIISLSRKDYLNVTGTFNLNEAFPNLDPHPYHWRVDPYEPNRVWFTTRVTATHDGPLKFFKTTLKPTHKQVYGAPECLSYTFNEEGKVTSFTGGYIMDRRVGNTKKMGALFGILAAIGGPIPEPETIPYAFFILSRRLRAIVSGVLLSGLATFSL
ncbi:hypothetical protein ABBQ32_002347 [Trebouxia sp. C0010 RCD-2024]